MQKIRRFNLRHFMQLPELSNKLILETYISLTVDEKIHFNDATCTKNYLTLLHSERPKLHTILAFLSAIELMPDLIYLILQMSYFHEISVISEVLSVKNKFII